MDRELAKIISKAIFLSSIQISIAAIEMNSNFAVLNFSTNQEMLQSAADALRSYMMIATAWTIGTVLSLFSAYGLYGSISGLIANMIIVSWIFFSYLKTFKSAAKKHKLEEPVIFTDTDIKIIIAGVIFMMGAIAYLSGYFS
jgi:hypothetical protein